MKGQGSQSVSCCGSKAASVGGLEASDFGALDQLAVKLICLDRQLESPLREMGRLIGYRIAQERLLPVPFETALVSIIPACGLEGVIEATFLRSSTDDALLQITGCATVLGWQVPNLGRAVCGFDAGLFEGFLCRSTGDDSWRVEETSCLGLGHPSCQFLIQRATVA